MQSDLGRNTRNPTGLCMYDSSMGGKRLSISKVVRLLGGHPTQFHLLGPSTPVSQTDRAFTIGPLIRFLPYGRFKKRNNYDLTRACPQYPADCFGRLLGGAVHHIEHSIIQLCGRSLDSLKILTPTRYMYHQRNRWIPYGSSNGSRQALLLVYPLVEKFKHKIRCAKAR